MDVKHAVLAGVFALGFALLSMLAGAQQQPLFRSGTELVDLYVTVTDVDGRLVPDLVQDDFAIFDDEVPHERLDLLSPLSHSVNPSVLILYV